MSEPVEAVARIGGLRVHRFQVVREHRGEAGGGEEGDVEEWEGGVEEWIVVGFDAGEVHLADQDFEWTRSVPTDAFRSGRFEPLSADGVPVWGY